MPFRDSKTLKIEMDYGNYLGRDEGCFELKRKDGKIEKYPHYSKIIGECTLKSGSYVSVDALIDLALWNIDTFIVTKRNRVVAILKNLEDDSHVETRINQYKALENDKGIAIAKQFITSKIEGNNQVLKKYGLMIDDIIRVKSQIESIESDSLDAFRRKLTAIESHNAQFYFKQIFGLIPEKIRPEKRTGYKSYDGINNVFNFGYYVLRCRIHKALINAKLEPYLGFLHTVQFGKPSLVCDFMEIYRFMIDNFLIQYYAQGHAEHKDLKATHRGTLQSKDFVMKYDLLSRHKIGKREYLNDLDTRELMNGLSKCFETEVAIPRIKYGKRQTFETLINEEALLFAKYLRNERKDWIPRMPII
jgi:CRISP-associated protein Cas1